MNTRQRFAELVCPIEPIRKTADEGFQGHLLVSTFLFVIISEGRGLWWQKKKEILFDLPANDSEGFFCVSWRCSGDGFAGYCVS